MGGILRARANALIFRVSERSAGDLFPVAAANYRVPSSGHEAIGPSPPAVQ